MESLLLALLLAQTCVAEISFQIDTRECQVMWHVNNANAKKRGLSLAEQTRQFNTYWRSEIRRARRPWIKYLNANLTKPKHWPATISWKNHKDRWRRYLDAARKFVRTDRHLKRPCLQALDYGSQTDVPKNKNYILTRCLGGNTKQRYWRHK